MLSLFLEAKRKKDKKTVLGIEYDAHTMSIVKLKKNNDSYELDFCESFELGNEAYIDNILSTEYVSNQIKNILKENSQKRVKLGSLLYEDVEVFQEEVSCDKRSIESIVSDGIDTFIREKVLKKKFPDEYLDISFDIISFSAEEGILKYFYVPEKEHLQQLLDISSKLKSPLAVCDVDISVVEFFIKELYISEISANKADSVLLGLYDNKICIYYFSNDGTLKDYESMKIFDANMDDMSYVDEVSQFLLRFMDFMALNVQDDFDSFDEDDTEESKVYIFGLKKGVKDLASSIESLTAKEVRMLNPFENVKLEAEIDNPFKYVLATAVAMREEY